MSGARDQILGAVRRAVRAGERPDGAGDVDRRIAAHARNIVPARVDRDEAALVDLFEAQALAASATVERLAGLAEVPDAIGRFLAAHNLPSDVKVAPDPELDGIDWQQRPTLQVSRGRGEATDLNGVTGCFAAVAETGTLMMASGPERPATLNFLPDNHIVIVARSKVVGPYEEGWDRLRQALGRLPRTVNFITGPSRTGDIEQKIQLGAHGPRRLHILLIDA